MNLSTTELNQLRADAESFLPDTCTIQTVTQTRDTQGGWTESWANTHTSIECRLAPQTQSGVETIEGGQVTSISRWVLTLHHDQTIDETMRVVHDSQTYEVEHLEDTHSNRTARRVYLRKLD
jgi:SPP1 family predicted phage head-tail adaptor